MVARKRHVSAVARVIDRNGNPNQTPLDLQACKVHEDLARLKGSLVGWVSGLTNGILNHELHLRCVIEIRFIRVPRAGDSEQGNSKWD